MCQQCGCFARERSQADFQTGFAWAQKMRREGHTINDDSLWFGFEVSDAISFDLFRMGAEHIED